MTKLEKVLISIVAILMSALCGAVATSYAQSGGPFTIYGSGGTHTSCPVIAVAQAPATCYPSDGVFYAAGATSAGGVGWAQQFPVPTSMAGVLKVQGVVPGATGNVQLTCTLSFPSTPATFSAGTSTSATIPASTINVPCTAVGN